MVATMDVTWSFKDEDLKILWEDTNEEGKDRDYSYLMRKVVPWLVANGLTKTSIDKFIIHNPRRLFTWL
jgi:predicted metal-dependent phosphotriesterase family hydrolase